jgi:hypothetical protein
MTKSTLTAPVRLEVNTTAGVLDHLERLVASGYFGKNTSEAAGQLLANQLRFMRRREPTFWSKPPKPAKDGAR